MDWPAALLRWFHELAAIMWLGLQYYTDLVYARARTAAAAAASTAILDNFVATRLGHALRIAAIVAWLLGCGLLSTLSIPGHNGFTEAFLLRGMYAPIGIGAWIGTVMLAITLGPMRTTNVTSALLWARVNTILSVPLLFFMAFGYSHQGIVGL
ncbi:MAG TPA: hypothetical protein VJP85_01410 [Candidatus Baltobacteraceae bacterium]|nr:hypothetical protein [Candidatus Baltobacteraceae bacterium]